MKRILMLLPALPVVFGLLATLSGRTALQQRQPVAAAAEFKVMRAEALADLEQKLHPKGKQDLITSAGKQTQMYLQHERDRHNEAEVHDAADDYHFVLEGTAVYTLGGRLEGAREKESGEWRGGRIVGGQQVELKKGDIIFVPRGTPHQRSTKGRQLSMMLIKVFATPITSGN